MKKKILSGIFALALLATSGFGVQKSMESDADLSGLALSNVEALAQSETNDEFTNKTDCIACQVNHSCPGKDGMRYSWAHHKNDPAH